MSLKELKGFRILLVILGSLILWQIAGAVVHKPMLPVPSKVISYLEKNFYSVFLIHGIYSIRRVVLGICLSLGVGIPVGILMGYSTKVDILLSPILYFHYPVPKMALLPIVMLFFGLGESSKLVMIFLITIFTVILQVRDGVKNIPETIFHPLHALGATHFQIIKEIILPGCISSILTSLRVIIGISISVLFFTENFGTEYGLGYLIMDAWMRVNYVEMYGGILVMSLLGVTLFIIIDLLEIILCPWNREKRRNYAGK